MSFRRAFLLCLLVTGLVAGCGSDDGKGAKDKAKAPTAAEFKQQFFQGDPLGFSGDDASVVPLTNVDEYVASSMGWWSPEDSPGKAAEDSAKLFRAVGLEAGASVRYSAKDDRPTHPHFIYAAVMRVRDVRAATTEAVERVKAMSTHACAWECVKESSALPLPPDSKVTGYSALREIRPNDDKRLASDSRQVFTTWTSGPYVHLAILISHAKGSDVKAFTDLVASEAGRTASS